MAERSEAAGSLGDTMWCSCARKGFPATLIEFPASYILRGFQRLIGTGSTPAIATAQKSTNLRECDASEAAGFLGLPR